MWWLIAAWVGLVFVRLPLFLSAAIMGGIAITLLTVVNPLIGLGVALLLGPLGALEKVFLDGLLDSSQLMLLFALAAWLSRNLLRRKIATPYMSLSRPLLFFILVAGFTIPGATSHPLGLIELLKWIEIALIMWMVVDIGRWRPGATSTTMRLLLVMLLLAGLYQAVIGIWQFGLRGTGPEHFLVLGGFYRAYGTFEQPNPYGGFMSLTALLAAGVFVGLVMASRTTNNKLKNSQFTVHDSQFTVHHLPFFWLLVSGTATLTTLALIFSWSRGAWLGFAAGIATLVLFSARSWRRGVVLLAGSTGLAAILLFTGIAIGLRPAATVIERIGGFREDLTFGDVRGVDINDANYAVLERLAHWQAALDMARDHLWTGVGFGNYEAAYPAYALINWPDALGHAHNYYLNLLAETGVPGLIAYVILWGAIIWQSLRLVRKLPWPDRGIALGLTSCWIALSVHHLVDKLYVNNIYIHLGVMLALLQLLDPAEVGVRSHAQPAAEVYLGKGNTI
jgi:O-antigen ligase